MEGFQLRNRHKDDNSLLAATNVHLTSSRNLKGAKIAFKFGYIVFEVDQSLCDISFNLIGGSGWSVGGTENFVVDGGHFEENRSYRARVNIQS
jgi:hypothetical protein